ncbi:MAG TPA: hypothetical protein VFN56_02455 [Candidatus Saccharimonadales bacterium]|nr:hypothetical protein [Candidatus Saccharimonadales bacterium]
MSKSVERVQNPEDGRMRRMLKFAAALAIGVWSGKEIFGGQ